MTSDNKLSLSEILFIIVIIEILMVLALWFYQGYQGKQQFKAALTEIQAISRSSQTTPSTSSSHCSKITMRTVDKDSAKQPMITCIISGNPKVRGKTLTYTRTHDGSWQCASNAPSNFYQPHHCIALP